MSSNRKGFDLVDLLLGVFLTSIVGLLLWASVFQDLSKRMAADAKVQQAQIAAAEEWKYEKYFEEIGYGIYHFVIPEDTSTWDVAHLLSQWRALHPDRRIVSVVESHDGLIIVTEGQ